MHSTKYIEKKEEEEEKGMTRQRTGIIQQIVRNF